MAAQDGNICGRGVVPLRHLRHVPPPPDSIATVVNSLQNQVNSVILCITLKAKNWENRPSPCDTVHSD